MHMENGRVRRAHSGDAQALAALIAEELGYRAAPEHLAERLALIADKEGHRVLVAERNGAVIGFIHLCDYDNLHSDHYKNIMGLAVGSGHRRLGAGRALLEAGERWARQTGAAGVRLVSGADRTGAHAFYASCGYTLRKDQKNFYKRFPGR